MLRQFPTPAALGPRSLGRVRPRVLSAWLIALCCAWPGRAAALDAIVRPARLHQRITGFGVSSAWTAPDLSDADADLLFSPDNGIGLSLLRVRIAPDGSCLEVATAQKAQARGAKVWATPWSPPAQWKSNNDVNHGGNLLAEHADDWAHTLVGFASMMKAQGVEISALSAQNEPTTQVNYESCVYTPVAMADFIGNHLRPALDAAGFSLPIIAPETQGWSALPSFSSAILGDPKTLAAVGMIATHEYDGSPTSSPQIAAQGKEFWQTEIYDRTKTADPGIGSGVAVALMVHAALVQAEVNAWHYWWIYQNRGDAPGNGALWDVVSGLPAKRLYALGNFSRFVRPGFYRIEVPLSPIPGLSLSAFYDKPSGAIVLVAINETPAPIAQNFLFDGVTTGSWQSWVTSAEGDLAPGSAVPDAATLSVTFGPQSVTTLRGMVTGVGPVLAESSSGIWKAPSDPGGCSCATVGQPAPVGSENTFLWAFGLALIWLASKLRSLLRD